MGQTRTIARLSANVLRFAASRPYTFKWSRSNARTSGKAHMSIRTQAAFSSSDGGGGGGGKRSSSRSFAAVQKRMYAVPKISRPDSAGSPAKGIAGQQGCMYEGCVCPRGVAAGHERLDKSAYMQAECAMKLCQGYAMMPTSRATGRDQVLTDERSKALWAGWSHPQVMEGRSKASWFATMGSRGLKNQCGRRPLVALRVG